ncbi:hypothetical protein [Butyrivibrio sp. NC3005]|uniref:hypothetical protein n=1 Tax=Butyrivibrio sp. NC3005 TaxID=1280685 RepID=UPI00040C2FDF|nr:hypothetical protein [Butyrivibrio sp. NC3005]
MKKILSNILFKGILLLCLLFVFRIVFYYVQLSLHVDFSFSYRNIDGYENIIFVQNKTAYKRSFWGLQKTDETLPLLEDASSDKDDKALKKLKEVIGENYYLSQCIFSPDNTKILYVEIRPWGEGAPTDDENYYCKVLDLKTKKTITVFKGPQQYFKVYWFDS